MEKTIEIIARDNTLRCTLAEFLEGNEESLTQEEIDTVKSLRYGQSFMLGVHFGWVEIRRMA